MATIIIDNSTSEQLGRDFLYRLDLEIGNDSKNDSGSHALLLTDAHQAVVGILRPLHKRLGDPNHTEEIINGTDTKISLKSDLLTDATNDVDITFNFTGTNLSVTNQATITGVQANFNSIRYFDDKKTVDNIDVNTIGATTVKIKYNPIESGNIIGNIIWQSDTASEKGYFLDEKKVKFDYSLDIFISGNLIFTPDNTVSGVINNLKKTSIDTDPVTKSNVSKSSINLISKLGIFVNEDEEYSGTIDALTFSSNRQNASEWSGGINYKETIANPYLASVLAQFIDRKSDTFDVTAALLTNNDKITTKGAWTNVNGYLGNDTITLGNGNDNVEFSTALGATNIDSIKGFKPGTDKIKLNKIIFSGYNGSQNFHTGTDAVDANHHIIYDNKTGKLYYDVDGFGSTTKIQFATLVGKPTLTAADIYTF